MLAESANPPKGGDATARAYLHFRVDTAAGLPKRRHDIRVRLIPFAVLFFTLMALPTLHQDRASAAAIPMPASGQDHAAIAGSSTIADEALKDLHTWQGQCFTWVKKVVDRATPYTMGYGYRDGYLGAGAVGVPLNEAVRGDIIQLANDAYSGPGAFYLGLHTAIVLQPLGAGRFDVIDSNQNWDEIVRLRPGYDPLASAGRYVGISVHVYRFPGGSATDAPPPPTVELAEGDPAVVSADGDCLRLRSEPSLSGIRLDCLPDGSAVSITGAARIGDGLVWVPVDTYRGAGWMAAIYLTLVADSGGEPISEAPVPGDTSGDGGDAAPVPGDTSGDGGDTPTVALEADGYTLAVPPQGGLTSGPAGTIDPAAFAEAQAFPVQTLLVFDIPTQHFLTFIPGAPTYVNSLTSANLKTDSIVTVTRAPSGAATGETPSVLPVTGATAFPLPPEGGLMQGLAGTSDVETLLAAQPFAAQTVLAWDVPAQHFLTFIPGAPIYVNTLSSANLRADMMVMIRRADGSQIATAPPSSSTRLVSSITYYCSQGSIPASIGDGGGWCGAMANGQVVYEGAAACSPQNMGQQFKIIGDPNARTYTCADTGSAVTGEHRDIFFHNSDDGYEWWLQVGTTATIEIVG